MHNASHAGPKCDTRSATGQPRHSEYQTNSRDRLTDPEEEHPLDGPRLERGHSRAQAALERLEFSIEASEVQVVELPQLGSVRGVHLIEPVHPNPVTV